MKGYIRPSITRLAHEEVLKRLLQGAGVSVDALYEDAQFQHLGRIQRLDRLTIFALDKLGDRPEGRHLALQIGQRGRLSRFGIFGHAMLNSGSVTDAMKVVLRQLWIVQEYSRKPAQLRMDGEYLRLIYSDPPVTPEAPHFRTELFFSSVISSIAELTGEHLEGIALELVHDPGCDVGEYEEILGIRVSFHADRYRLLIPKALAETPLPASYNTHSDAYLTQCETLLSQMKQTSGTTTQLRRALLRGRAEQRNMSAMCDKLAMSERTLRRRLSDEGTQFQEVLDDVRNHLARNYLTETDLLVSQISGLLGFSDTSTFRKAFKKWNSGLTPGSLRKQFTASTTRD